MVASYTSSNTYIFDIETGKQVLMLETKLNSGNTAAFYSTFLDFLEFQLHIWRTSTLCFDEVFKLEKFLLVFSGCNGLWLNILVVLKELQTKQTERLLYEYQILYKLVKSIFKTIFF